MTENTKNIWQAARKGSLKGVVYHYLKNPSVIHSKMGIGPHWTAIFHAALENHLDIVQFLISRGAQVDVIDSDFKTPMIWAAFKGHVQMVEFLLDNGANINYQDEMNHWSALHWAVSGGNLTLVRLLVERGADRTLENGLGQTPYIFAIYLRESHPINDYLATFKDAFYSIIIKTYVNFLLRLMLIFSFLLYHIQVMM